MSINTATAGVIRGAYRWPDSSADMAENLKACLNQNTNISSFFTSEITSTTQEVKIKEITAPDIHQRPSTIFESDSPIALSINTIQASQIPTSEHVKYAILGVLSSLQNGIAQIDNNRTFKVKLSGTSSPIIFDPEFPASVEARTLSGSNNGQVTLYNGNDYDLNAGIFLALQEAQPGEKLLVQFVAISD